MANIGFYGSSFDPITEVHLFTANTIADRCKLDQVIFSPSSSKRSDKTMHTADEHRWNMLQIAIERNPRFIADDFEMQQDAWKVYSYLTMREMKKRFPNDTVYFIMGADILVDIAEGKWKHAEELVGNNRFIVMARDNIDMLKTISHSPLLRQFDDGRFHLIDKGIALEISSTYIRQEFERGGDPRYLLPEACYEYIQKHQLYHT